MLQVIHIDELTTGMFVNGVVKQNGQLKVKTKGLVSSIESVETLRNKGVIQLEIDLSRSKLNNPTESERPVAAPEKPKKNISDQEQLSTANRLYDEAKVIQNRFFKRLAANDTPSLEPIESLSKSIIESVFAMPSALACLTLLNKSGQYLLEHSLNCSILLTLFAKHKELSQQEIEQLSLSGLLMDVGMTNMPDSITESTNKLSPADFDVMTTHVDIGLDMVERCGQVSEIVRDIVFNHHERIDGTGYPDKQRDVDVSIYARMAAIVDSYDAMTSVRPYQKIMPPTLALRKLLGDGRYDQTLVHEFIQCMGVHPVGSLVKLDNDRLGIVIRSNPTSPLQPIVATFYHTKSSHFSPTKFIDLKKSKVKIESSVRPEEFNLNLSKFFRDVLVGG